MPNQAIAESNANQDANTNLDSAVASSANDTQITDASFELDLSTGSPSYAPVIISPFLPYKEQLQITQILDQYINVS